MYILGVRYMMELKGVLPAVRSMKDFDKILESSQEHIILLETRLSQIDSMVKYAKQRNKKVLVHVDLIQGLKADEYGIEYLIRVAKVDGLISTRNNVISYAKKKNVTSIQRLFALDSHALEHNIKIINTMKPDYIEILPGVVPGLIQEVYEKTGIPVIAGGLIRNKEDVQSAFENGAQAITTSQVELWDFTTAKTK
jgi:glycerol uptake operon antiterminator